MLWPREGLPSWCHQLRCVTLSPQSTSKAKGGEGCGVGYWAPATDHWFFPWFHMCLFYDWVRSSKSIVLKAYVQDLWPAKVLYLNQPVFLMVIIRTHMAMKALNLGRFCAYTCQMVKLWFNDSRWFEAGERNGGFASHPDPRSPGSSRSAPPEGPKTYFRDVAVSSRRNAGECRGNHALKGLDLGWQNHSYYMLIDVYIYIYILCIQKYPDMSRYMSRLSSFISFSKTPTWGLPLLLALRALPVSKV